MRKVETRPVGAPEVLIPTRSAGMGSMKSKLTPQESVSPLEGGPKSFREGTASSREAAKECSPRRKPRIEREMRSIPEGARDSPVESSPGPMGIPGDVNLRAQSNLFDFPI